MSQDENHNTAEPVETAQVQDTPAVEPSPADGPTIGTGTSLALGCVAGTILLILIGLIYVLILAVF